MKRYFGTYEDFQTASKADAGPLLGANNAVGDIYDIDIELEESTHKAWLVSKYSDRIGYFDAGFSRKLSLLAADGLQLRGILSFVAFTDHPDDGHYWGQAAVICYSAAYEAEFDHFIANVAAKIGEDVRPRIDLGEDAANHIIESNGAWMPKQTVSLPAVDKGMAIIKRRRGVTDKLIAQGRAGNKGCYVLSWVFLLALVALIVFGAKSCFGW